MTTSHTRHRGSRRIAVAAAAIAMAGLGIAAPATPATAAPAVTIVPSAPVAGSAFNANWSGLANGETYRAILTATNAAADRTDVAEANECAAGRQADPTFLTCWLTDNTGGTYDLKLLSGETLVHQVPVTILPSITIPPSSAPVAIDIPASPNDVITIRKVDNIDWSYKTGAGPATPVTFATNETSKDVAVVGGSDTVVTATPKTGFAIAEGTQSSWTFRLGGTTNVVWITPTAPTASDQPGTSNDAVILTKTAGADWRVNGILGATFAENATTALVPFTWSSAKVTATALPGYAFDGSVTTKTYTVTFSGEPRRERVAGADRMATAVAISKKYFPNRTEAVFIANGLRFPDALAAGPAAARAYSPLLLTGGATVPAFVLAEVRRLAPAAIYIVGGPDVLSANVASQLGAIASVTRLAGNDRHATAAEVSKRWTSAATVYLATGRDFPDALSGGSGAAKERMPLLLADLDTIPDVTVTAIRRLAPSKIVLVGGTGVLSDAVERQAKGLAASVVRYAGADRYATSADVVAKVTSVMVPKPTTALLATGRNYPDALAGVPAAAVAKAPLLLTQPNCLPAVMKTVVDGKLALDRVVRLGSAEIVGDFDLSVVCQ